jgi:hypothetical protein
MLESLIEQVKENTKGKKIRRAYGDGGYDSGKNFNYLSSNGVEPVIKTRRNSSTRARGSPGLKWLEN